MSYPLNSTYLYFAITDYSGAPALSTYSLDITPLHFVPDFTTSELLSSQAILSNKTIRWDFGDGSYANTLTATHTYNWPGSYPITLTLFDENGNAYDSSYKPVIQVYDFIQNQLEFVDAASPSVYNQKFIGPLTVLSYNSWQSYPAVSGVGYTIGFYASGAGGDYESLINFTNDKWSHLRSLHQFYTIKKIYNLPQFTPIESLTAVTTEIYAYNNGGTLQICDPGTPGSVLVGTTGYCDIYFSDDTITNVINQSPTYLFATLEDAPYHDALTQRNNLYNYISYLPHGFQNLAPQLFILNRTKYDPAHHIDITTTGIAGEGNLSSTSFDIPYISWQNTKVPFVITLKDINNFTTKFYPPLSSSIANNFSITPSAFDVKLGIVYTDLSGNNIPLKQITFYEDFDAEAPQNIGSFYKGYFVSDDIANNCTLTASMVVVDPVTQESYTITGASNTFNIFPATGQYNIAKINEDWNASGYYDSLRYQENLIYQTEFFDGFLRSIVGGASAYPYELGKTVYEKIANFTDNKSDVDKVNIDSLLAFCDELKVQFENYNYDFPPQLRRIVNILSIKQKNLWGSPNTYKQSFNTGSDIITDVGIGINLGSQISILTGSITTCTPIVAYEKFSGNYTLINAECINGYAPGYTLPLSSYSYDWGWGLVVPETLTGIKVKDYYDFYRFNNVSDGKYLNSIINWDDPYTTLTQGQSSFGEWSVDDGIMQTLISYELSQGLNLFTSASPIPADTIYSLRGYSLVSMSAPNYVVTL